MSERDEPIYYVPTRRGSPWQAVAAIFAVIGGVLLGLLVMRYMDIHMPARAETKTAPTVVVPPPPVVPPLPAVVPTAYIPVVQQVEYEPAPPAGVEPEAVQPRTEIVNVQRAPDQTTIIRTVPQNPAGAPIVVDKGEKRRGAPRP